MVSSNHLLLILIGLETASLPLCVLMALSDKRYGLEAGIKYFTMGAMAARFCYGGDGFLPSHRELES